MIIHTCRCSNIGFHCIHQILKDFRFIFPYCWLNLSPFCFAYKITCMEMLYYMRCWEYASSVTKCLICLFSMNLIFSKQRWEGKIIMEIFRTERYQMHVTCFMIYEIWIHLILMVICMSTIELKTISVIHS